MGFDYEKIIESLKKSMNIMNIEGRAQTIKILEYLKECPFVDIIAEYMGCSTHYIYRKLKYHLDDQYYIDLLDDLVERRRIFRGDMIKEYIEKLENIDENNDNIESE